MTLEVPLKLQQESLFINDAEHQLHLRHIYKKANGVPVLMLHGVIENGKIFYTQSGKGLACFLADHGFDVYVADFRGKGLSKPSLKANSSHGQFETITQDIPLFLDFITKRCQQKIHVICHSWGGVLFSSCLARYPKRVSQIASNICFGSKRSIYQKGFQKWWKVDLFWNKLAPSLARKNGYIDAVKLKFGSDNESLLFLQQSIEWVKILPWKDPKDNYDYSQGALLIEWPDTWHITGINDKLLGHKDDVRAFIDESNKQAKFSLLSKDAGNAHNYDHIDILTHIKAVDDHFPKIVDWLKARGC
ncbi:alpha/beta fold hydrolase [Colwelliaceae bacterium 6441]